MTTLSVDQGKILLKLARTAIENRLGCDSSFPKNLDDALDNDGGTFVTLKKKGQLRGCIGNITPIGSIWESVRNNAVSAAFFDSRFDELSLEELRSVKISISILSPAKALEYGGGEDLCRKLQPGVDGVILRKGRCSATFLPQVWDQLPRPEDFLAHLCQKAGLQRDCWVDEELEIQIYHVQSFTEDE